jgi:hypothetical protein
VCLLHNSGNSRIRNYAELGAGTAKVAGDLELHTLVQGDLPQSAAVVHANDAKATVYPAPSGLTPCKRCKKSGA